ncbi:MAG: ATP-binding protein [Candidatus Omnitrophota bacterium]|nr:ATP-binding protein [Candidatus Omnitrophota bacterium]
MNIYAVTSLFGSTSTLLLGIFVYFQNRQRTLNRVFCLLSISIFLWVFGCFRESSVATRESALFWDRFLYTGAAFAPTLFLHVSLLVAEQKRKKILTTLYALSIIFLILNLLPSLRNFFILDVQHKFPFRYIAVPGPLWYPYLSYFAFCGLYPFYILTKTFITEKSPYQRERLKYMMISLLVIFVAASMYLSLVLSVASPPIDNLLVSLFSLITAYLIVRHRLMDIKIAAARTAIFTFVYAFVLGIPFLIVKLAKSYLVGGLGERWWLVILVIGMLLSGIGPFIFMGLKSRAEAALLREERARHEALRRVSQTILRFNRLYALLRAITHNLIRIMQIKLAAIYLLDEEKKAFILKSFWQPPFKNPDLTKEFPSDSALIKRLSQQAGIALNLDELKFHSQRNDLLEVFELKKTFESLKAQLIIPAIRADKLIGFLVLGEKRSERGYTQEDIEVLTVLSNHATLAIENAIFSESEKERQAIMFHSVNLASLGTMASMMGHQINNRFQAVNNLAGTADLIEAMLEAKENSSADELKNLLTQSIAALRKISEEATRGGQTVASIRRLSRFSAEEFKPISIREPLDVALGVLQYKLKFDEFELKMDIPDTLPKIWGDVAQLGEVCLNLIDNGYDALMERMDLNGAGYKPRITIAAHLKPDAKHLIFEVSDNGMGVREENLTKLFVPFFTTKASSGKGTGLGLHVIKRIIEFHKGKISIHSQYGEGTSFRMELPVAVEKNQK